MRSHNRRADDEINIKDLLETLLRAKWVILAVALTLGVLAGAGSSLRHKTYRAETVISPVVTTPGSGALGGLSSIASQLGGLASLAGLSASGESKRWESVAVLESEALAEKYIQENNLLPILYAKQWDAATGKWRTTDPDEIPTVWKASQRFKKGIYKVVNDNRTGLFTLTVTWTDPKLAAQWANDLVKLANVNLRRRAIDEAERNISYLTEQAAKTDVVGVKQAIYSVLQNEISKEMLARGTEEYAFRVLDPAAVPERPSSFPPLIWGLIGFALGAIASAFVVITRMAWSRQDEVVSVTFRPDAPVRPAAHR